MATFILTWNPDRWPWPPDEYAQAVQVTSAGRVWPDRWSVGIRRNGISPGDRAMLLRQARDRGLVASGIFTSSLEADEHWDDSGRPILYGQIEWDIVLDVADRLPTESLKKAVPDVTWDRIQGSGVKIPERADEVLKDLWTAHVNGLTCDRQNEIQGASAPVVASGRTAEARPGDWTEAENRAIVDDYLEMLAKECAGKPYSKTEHRKALIEAMGGTRSRGSIEMKHQNISAVMLELGLPYIKGYKPLPNIQEALLTEVRRRLETDPEGFAKLRPQDPQPPSPMESRLAASLRQVPVPETPSEPRGRKVDYGLLQEESKRIGDLGEEFVLRHEKEALEKQGRPDLAADVIWAARENGDGLGYDILSFTPEGHPRYIEVKATKLGALTPFYITSAELDFARRHQDEYAIYRVFNIDGDTPEFYVLAGNLETQLSVEPVTYRARPA